MCGLRIDHTDQNRVCVVNGAKARGHAKISRAQKSVDKKAGGRKEQVSAFFGLKLNYLVMQGELLV